MGGTVKCGGEKDNYCLPHTLTDSVFLTLIRALTILF